MDNINKRLDCALKEVRRNLRLGEKRILAKKMLFLGHGADGGSEEGRKQIVKAFFTELEYRQKANKGNVDYQRFYYYIAKNGRLASINRQKAEILIRRGKIKDHVAYEEIPQGTYVKHRRIIDSLEKNSWRLYSSAKTVLEEYFDETLPCTMTIDTDFERAYSPCYHGCTTTDGDLATDSSCMSERGDEAQEFYGGIEGCKVARFETSDGQQVGRCIVYEHEGKRHFVRIYGQAKYHRTMINLIKDQLNDGDLFGRDFCFKNMSLKTNWTFDTPNMYVDGCYGISRRDNIFYVEYGGEFEADSTSSGTLGDEFENYAVCDHCGDRVSEDDAYWIDGYCYCCESCAEQEGYVRCEHCGEFVDKEDALDVDDCVFCCGYCATIAGYTQCQECYSWVRKDDMRSSENEEIKMCKFCLENDERYALDENNNIIETARGENNE